MHYHHLLLLLLAVRITVILARRCRYSTYAGASLSEEAGTAIPSADDVREGTAVRREDLTALSSETVTVVLEAVAPPQKPQRDAPPQRRVVRAAPGLSPALRGPAPAMPLQVGAVLNAATAALEDEDEDELL